MFDVVTFVSILLSHHFLSRTWDLVFQGSMKDLRSFHAKTCFVPDQFLSLQGHLFLVHSPLRGANHGEKEALKPEDCGMKRGPTFGAFRKHLP